MHYTHQPNFKVKIDLLLNSVTIPIQMSDQSSRRLECDQNLADAEFGFAV